MRRIILSDMICKDVWASQYDWFIVGVGAESRSCCIVDQLVKHSVNVKNALLLCYPDVKPRVRKRILDFVSRLCGRNVFVMEMQSDAYDGVYKILNSKIAVRDVQNVLVDYSGMSRVWYAAMLSWFYRRCPENPTVQLSFLYAEGKYTKDFAQKDVVIEEIRAVPGCEGEIYRRSPTSLAMGLGFRGYTSLCVCDQLEPDDIYTFVTNENPLKQYPIERQEGNQELMKRASRHFKIPLESVVSAYRCMSEIAATERINGHGLIIVPMGPKPHVLAAVLVGLSNHEVCVMRVRHNHYLDDVKPNGRVVATRIKFIDVDIPASGR